MSLTPNTILAGIAVLSYSAATDVSNILNLTFTNNTVPNLNQVGDLITRSDAFINQVSGHNWTVNNSTEYYDAIGSGPKGGAIVLRNRPVISVTEVDWWYGGIQAWMPGLYGFPENALGVQKGPSTVLDSFQISVPTDQLQQPQTYLVYFPEGKIVWNTMRLDSRLRYRVVYTWGYTVTPDFIRDLSSTLVARDILIFWGSQLNVQEDITLFKKRLDEKINRLIARATQRPSAQVG